MNVVQRSPRRMAAAPLLPAVLLVALLAGCGSTRTAPDQSLAQGHCGPCCDRDPSAEASAAQGRSSANPDNPYVGKDAYTNVVVKEGTVFYSLTPGATPRFAVTEQTLRDAGGNWRKYYELVQVNTDPGTDADGKPRRLRESVRTFHVTEPLCAAHGSARANPQFGAGGGAQYFISPSDGAKLRQGDRVPLWWWTVVELDAR